MPNFFRKKKDNPSNLDNKNWWEENPMQYNWNENEEWINKTPKVENVTRSFFEKIDERFFSISQVFAKKEVLPFNHLIDFEKLENKKVLEIGCGFGSHAQLILQNSNKVEYTGVDITKTAIDFIKKRFEIFGLNGQIIECDAEKLPFEDSKFDFIWSWGVIHHSKNTEKILDEIRRVLKPNGSCTLMVYNKNSLRYYLYGGLFKGIMCLKLLKKNLQEINMEFTDGYFARHFTSSEIKRILKIKELKIKKVFALPETDHLPFPGGYRLMKLNLKFVNYIIEKLLRKFGWFLIIKFKKEKID